ncbi:MAG: DUF167 domain-containing protein [Patescibacteria group bacterium]|nr:DUF167 domain-containing protein [Patescibacteria group bacterium]
MYVSVRVVTEAGVERVEELKNGRLRLWVKEPAKQNLANRRATFLVARHFRVPAGKVRLVAGAHEPSKLFSLPG